MVLAMLKNLFASRPPAPVPVARAVIDPLGALIATESAHANEIYVPGALSAETGSEGRLAAQLAVAEAGQPLLRLSAGNPDAGSWAQTGGFSIHLSDEFETRASGNPITVTALVRAAGAAAAEFALTYSTNEVGNAGWQRFTAASDWAAYRFDYAVPPMVSGYGDFVGILPAPEGQPGIEVALVIVRLVQPA